MLLEQVIGFSDGKETRHPVRAGKRRRGREENELGRLQGLGDFDGDIVGIHAIGATFPVETERRNHGHDPFFEQELERLRIHALHLPVN